MRLFAECLAGRFVVSVEWDSRQPWRFHADRFTGRHHRAALVQWLKAAVRVQQWLDNPNRGNA